jgi:hypothetical protein
MIAIYKAAREILQEKAHPSSPLEIWYHIPPTQSSMQMPIKRFHTQKCHF